MSLEAILSEKGIPVSEVNKLKKTISYRVVTKEDYASKAEEETGINLRKAFNRYYENHNGFRLVKFLLNFEVKENNGEMLIIDPDSKDMEILACNLDFDEVKCYVGVDRENVARVYFADGKIMEFHNATRSKVSYKYVDAWDRSLKAIIPINRDVDPETIIKSISNREAIGEEKNV